MAELGSVTVRNCFAETLVIVCTMPEGHSTRTVSATVASPSPKCALSSFWLAYPAPVPTTLSCHIAFPPIVAWTCTLAPIADRFDEVPTQAKVSQLFELPLLM